VNHVAFFLTLEHEGRDLYPLLREGYRAGRLPKPPLLMPRCWNKVRYEVMDHLGYFCTESSEHLAEYVPWFIKDGREDLIEEFKIPLDEYPLRCVEQAEGWAEQARGLKAASGIAVEKVPRIRCRDDERHRHDTPYVAYANLPNRGQVPQLPMGAAVEVPTL
jgi:alpha-galactosidase